MTETRTNQYRPHRALGIVIPTVLRALVLAAAPITFALSVSGPQPAARGAPYISSSVLKTASSLTNQASTIEEQWQWPTRKRHLAAPFINPPQKYGAGHRGIDIFAQPGDLIYASADGTVRFSGSVAGRSTLSIDHGGGLISAIEPVESSLLKGAIVKSGQIVGVVRSGGHCDNRCVHFGVRMNEIYVNPLLYLGGLTRPVLLPWQE